jgi:hypothetical protein
MTVACFGTELDQDLGQDSRIIRLENDHRDLARKIDSLDVANVNKKLYDLGIAIARIEGTLGVPKKTPHAWVTPLLGFAGACILAFWGWMAISIVQHGNTLSSIRQSMLSQGITIAASNPTSPRALDEVRSTLADARKHSLPIPVSVVKNGGESFIKASENNSKAWDVALDLVTYRSSINKSPEHTTNRVPREARNTNFYVVGVTGKELPAVFAVEPFVPGPQAARWDLIDRDQNAGIKMQTFWLVAKGGATSIDMQHLRNVVFEKTEIHYSGVRVILENVIFVNCTFLFDNVPNSRGLGEQLLATSAVNFRAG